VIDYPGLLTPVVDVIAFLLRITYTFAVRYLISPPRSFRIRESKVFGIICPPAGFQMLRLVNESAVRFDTRVGTALAIGIIALAGLARPQSGFASTVTLDFDAPEYSSGSSLALVGDIGFRPDATVFTPVHVATFSGTQALKVSNVCTTPDCTNGAYRMEIRFGQPLPAPANAWLWRRVDSVSMRIRAVIRERKYNGRVRDMSGLASEGFKGFRGAFEVLLVVVWIASARSSTHRWCTGEGCI
jgi:hypothetical protein